MDNITHSLAGLLLAESAGRVRGQRLLPSPRVRAVAAVASLVAANLPDADLFYTGAGRDRRLARLGGLLASPEQLQRKHAQEQDNAERTLRIVKALPDAFLYQLDGEEIGTPGMSRAGVRLIRLKFRPDPGYQPPSHVEQMLEGMQGVILIDPVAKRIAKIDGTLFKEVSFGWGILGHLDKGGHFEVEQADLGDGSWGIAHMSLRFNGKILLFKSISINSDEVFSDFRRVPAETTFAQGVEMLKAELATLAQKGMKNREAPSLPTAIEDTTTEERG